jgi:hypothetical protein
MEIKSKRGNTIQVVLRDLTGEYELGIENLSLLLHFKDGADPSFLIKLETGISDREAVIALKALTKWIEVDGLPRLAAEEDTERCAGYH